MKIYYYDEADPSDQRAPHDSGVSIEPENLAPLGVLTYHFDTIPEVEELAKSRKYKHRDEVTISPTAMGEELYKSKLATFFDEHLHEDEEIRYILDGSGYFDVRGKDEKWIRVALAPGDLMILPPGIWHRFTPDEQNYTKAMRLFRDDPKWTPLPRKPELEENAYRKAYLQSIT